MTWEIIFVLALLAGALLSFVAEKIPTDQTALTVFALLLIAGLLPAAATLPSPNELLGVLANPAPVTIGAMFILSAALEKCGAIELLSGWLRKLAHLGFRRSLFVLVLAVAMISAFINNTPVVVVFLPLVLGLARELGTPASKLLIPLSYASIFGGTCTLVGTSTNILASGILESRGFAPIGMFELAAVGVPLLIAGIAYLVFVAPHLLPRRENLTAILSDEERREYLTEAYIQANSSLVGSSLGSTGLLRRGIRVLEIIRHEVALREDLRDVALEAGDRLVLSCRPSGFAHARSQAGLDLLSESDLGLETISAHEGKIVEGVIGPRSSIVGQTVRELNFRQRFRMIILAIHRRGVNVRDQLETMPLEFGDTLLMMGTDEALNNLRRSEEILLLDRPSTPAVSFRRKMPIVLATAAGVILAASLGIAPIVAAAVIGCAVIFASGCLQPKDGYRAIEWSILILIYGMLALGMAMEATGVADLIARLLIGAVAAFPVGDSQPIIVLAAIYLVSMGLTEALSNNATVALMMPIALGIGAALGIDPRPFAIAVCVASSASFATPIGYQTNTYVYGVGGYRFADFTRVGLPLNLLYFAGSLLLIPQFWPFSPA